MKLSLCIPTNGIVEWISKVIESIYSQDVPLDQFEVVIIDNGDNALFFDYISSVLNEHKNIEYKKTKCPIFMSEIEAYLMAEGDLIKFVNHRTILLDGTLKKWISFMELNYERKPIVYFSNGVLDKFFCTYHYDRFEDFIRNLSYWSSWSTGMTIWRDDIDGLGDKDDICELFPHTAILFKNYKNREYLIDNSIYLYELPHSSKHKGRYDLFYAFSVEYPSLLLELYKKGDIGIDTFIMLKQDLFDFIMNLHRQFITNKEEASYDLSSFKKNIEVFYSREAVNDWDKRKKEIFSDEWNRRKKEFEAKNDIKVVFGAGDKGREQVQKEDKDHVFCFIDNDLNKQGKMLLGIPVVSLDYYLDSDIDALIIVATKKENRKNIEKQLICHEVKNYLTVE